MITTISVRKYHQNPSNWRDSSIAAINGKTSADIAFQNIPDIILRDAKPKS